MIVEIAMKMKVNVVFTAVIVIMMIITMIIIIDIHSARSNHDGFSRRKMVTIVTSLA
jgi:hypothetical protein